MTGPRRGEIYTVYLGATEGGEQRGVRPAVVVSNNAFNAARPLATVVPLTTYRDRRIFPSEAVIPRGDTGLDATSIALCQQVRTLSHSRIGARIGRLSSPLIAMVDDALRSHLGLDSP